MSSKEKNIVDDIYPDGDIEIIQPKSEDIIDFKPEKMATPTITTIPPMPKHHSVLKVHKYSSVYDAITMSIDAGKGYHSSKKIEISEALSTREKYLKILNNDSMTNNDKLINIIDEFMNLVPDITLFKKKVNFTMEILSKSCKAKTNTYSTPLFVGRLLDKDIDILHKGVHFNFCSVDNVEFLNFSRVHYLILGSPDDSSTRIIIIEFGSLNGVKVFTSDGKCIGSSHYTNPHVLSVSCSKDDSSFSILTGNVSSNISLLENKALSDVEIKTDIAHQISSICI